MLADLVAATSAVIGEGWAGHGDDTHAAARKLFQYVYDAGPILVASRTGTRRSIAAFGALCAAVLAADHVSGHVNPQSPAPDALADLLNLAIISLPVPRFVRGLREQAIMLDERRAEVVEQAVRLAAVTERQRHERLLHDSALQVFEAIAKGWDGPEGSLLMQIDAETERLRQLSEGGRGGSPLSLESQLHGLVDAVWRPYEERRAQLEARGLPARGVPVLPSVGWEHSPALFRACAEQGVEDVVLKELAGATSRPSASSVATAMFFGQRRALEQSIAARRQSDAIWVGSITLPFVFLRGAR